MMPDSATPQCQKNGFKSGFIHRGVSNFGIGESQVSWACLLWLALALPDLFQHARRDFFYAGTGRFAHRNGKTVKQALGPPDFVFALL